MNKCISYRSKRTWFYIRLTVLRTVILFLSIIVYNRSYTSMDFGGCTDNPYVL